MMGKAPTSKAPKGKAAARKEMSARAPAMPWSVPVTLEQVPESGLHYELEADAPTRAAIAKSAGLRDLPRLAATFDLKRRAGNGLEVAGQVSATVGQACVVTLDAIENEIEERVDLVFLPGAPGAAARGESLPIDQEAPEPLVNETVDLGAIAIEFLILGIDPYPRRLEAVFEAPAAGEASAHPFAALAALKKGRGNRDS